MKKIQMVIPLILLTYGLFAQLPNTDVWLLDIQTTKDTLFFSNPTNITNRAGYDNQPAFSPDGKYILYTSIRDEKQSDIYKYDIKTKTVTQFTNTSTSEYSPTFMPDGKNISVVMVETDSAQRLWKFPIKGGAPELIMKGIDSIGYHCWLDETHVALFLITNPFQLVFTDIKTERKTVIVHDTIARGMALQKNNFFYVYKDIIYSVTLKNKNGSTPKWNKELKGEDFCFLNPNTPIMADGGKIYKYFNWRGNSWLPIVDLSKYEINHITRMAVSPDGKHIAIVSEVK